MESGRIDVEALVLRRPDLIVPVRVDPTGVNGPKRWMVRRPDWRRCSCGLYVPGWVDVGCPEQRIVEAAAVLTPPESERSWSIEQPSWWTPTQRVAQRRGLDAHDVALAYRRGVS